MHPTRVVTCCFRVMREWGPRLGSLGGARLKEIVLKRSAKVDRVEDTTTGEAVCNLPYELV
jgi:hypothetical protein